MNTEFLFKPQVNEEIVTRAANVFELLKLCSVEDRIATINQIKLALREHSPLANEPVDCVLWVQGSQVQANDYNPNSVAPPEMELLRLSIMADGYTQPIVTCPEDDAYTVVDGFHRNRVGKECGDVRERCLGYLPIVQIKPSQTDRGERIASTIRHNRARGKHSVEGMSEIVIELKKRNWNDAKIAKSLGMDQDEILRLCQISGLSELFADQEFSRAWDVEGDITEADYKELTEDDASVSDDVVSVRTVNTADPNRIFHTYEKWECYKAGLYETTKEGMKKPQAEALYEEFLADLPRFEDALQHVITEWKHSCEHYLTNVAMNRVAWLGQAAACYALNLPATYRGGFYNLSEAQQNAANEKALEYLNKWLSANGRATVTMEEAYSYDRQSDIY